MKKLFTLLLTLAIVWMPHFQTGNAQNGVIEFTKLSSENVTVATSCYLTEKYAVWIENVGGASALMAYDLTTKERFRLNGKDVNPYHQSENRLYASGDYCAFFNVTKKEDRKTIDVYGYDIKNKKEFKLNKKETKGQNLAIWKNYAAWPDYNAGVLLADIKKPDKEPILLTSNKSVFFVQNDNGYVVWEHKDENKPPDPATWNSGEKILAYEIATGKTFTVAENGGFYSSTIISGNFIFYTVKKQLNSFFCDIMGYDIAKKESFKVLEMSPVGTNLHMNPNANFLLFKNGTNQGSFAYNPKTRKILKVSQGSFFDFYSGGCAWGNYSVSCRTVSPIGAKFMDGGKNAPFDTNLELFDIRDGKTIVLADARLGIGYRTRCRTNGEYVIFQQSLAPNFKTEIMLVKFPRAEISAWATKEHEIRTAIPAQIISERDSSGVAKAKTQNGEILLTFANKMAANSNVISPGNMCYLVGVMGKDADGKELLNVEVSRLIEYEFPRTGETRGVCGVIVRKVEELGKFYITDSDGYDWIIKFSKNNISKEFWDNYAAPGKYMNAFGWAEEDDAGYKVMTAYGVSGRDCPCTSGYNTSEIEADNKTYFKNGDTNAFNTAPVWSKEDILVEIEALNNIIGAESAVMLSEDMEIVFYVKYQGHRIYLTLASKTARFDDMEFQLTAAPVKTETTIMVPLGIIASKFGAECELREEEKKLVVKMKKTATDYCQKE